MADPLTIEQLRARATDLMPGDRRRFRRRLSGAEKITDRRHRAKVLGVIEREIEEAAVIAARRRALVPTAIEYPDELPITDRRDDLMEAIRSNQVVIVAGETGSGKSTQLPKLCLELGRGVERMIGHTQPRRIAARSIAERVAEELKTSVGELVGYTVRFTDQVGENTLIKVMTDGILLNEIHHDRRLDRYDTIILDEAHERTLNIDFLLGYLKGLLARRRDLKLIITSATIDTERFAAHFDGAPVVEVSGRMYPVEVRYRPLDDPGYPEPRDQPQAICDAVSELSSEGRGDVLVFCSGEREIRDAADALAELGLRHTEVLPLYGRLSAAEQHRVFQPHTGRRIVLSTNVAETSLTVPGIRYVVDAGTARISRYSRRTKVQRLPIEPVSRASAGQRAGRCGRLGPGICIRLYGETDHIGRPEFTEPEILRTNLASVILQMAALDLGEIESFPFLDPPDHRAIRDGIALLTELKAVNPEHQGSRRWLTDLGRRLSRLPVDPRIGRMILEAGRTGCLREVLVIGAALSIQDPRERPSEHEAHADQLHSRFKDPDSDFAGWLQLWEYVRGERKERTSNQFRKMCREEYLNYRRVREWQDIHSQLREIATDLGFTTNRKHADAESIHKALLTGLLSQVGRKDPDGYEYRGARGARFSISPGSGLFKRAPEWVMAAELVETSRLWAHTVAALPVEWIEEAAAHLIKRRHGDPWWQADRGTAVANETVTLYGIPIASDRTVQLGRLDPEAARDLFIRHALVAGEWEAGHAFVEHNRALVDEVLELEARKRQSDLFVRDEAIVEFFNRRIPDDIVSVQHFDRWWRTVRPEQPYLLDLSVDDLLDPDSDQPDPEAFPEIWRHGDLALPLEYEFDSESPTDGITIDVPTHGLDRLNPSAFQWHVPGRRAELVEALVRSLPKQLRRRFVPINETVAELLDKVGPDDGPLIETVRTGLSRIAGEAVPRDAFDLDRLPPHLRPRFRVVGDEGSVVAEGDDLGALRDRLVEETRAAVAGTGHSIERSGITDWDFGELPREVEIGEAGHRARAYPALIDTGDSVAIRLLATPEEQADAMWDGTARLLRLHLPNPNALLRPLVTDQAKRAIRSGPYGAPADWIADCVDAAMAEAIGAAGGPAWNAVDFDTLYDRARDTLPDLLDRIGEESLAALETFRAAHAALDRVPAGLFDEAADDIATQLDRLVYSGFLSGVGASRLPDIHRYLRGALQRLEKLPANPGRDHDGLTRIRTLEAEHERLLDAIGVTPELIDVSWQLEELRVSLFAQSLGTRGKVSEKRISQRLTDIAIGG